MSESGDLSSRHEREVARALGGAPTVGSGSVREPLDVWVGAPGQDGALIVSCKESIGVGLRVTRDLWREVAALAGRGGMEPALALRLYGPSGYHGGRPVDVDLLAVSVDHYASLWREVRHLRDPAWVSDDGCL